jgi:hypothetical protein
MVALGFMIRNVDDSFHIVGASEEWFLSGTGAAAQSIRLFDLHLRKQHELNRVFIRAFHLLLCLVPRITVELRWVSLVLLIETVVWSICLLVPDIKNAIDDFPLTAAIVMVALTFSWALSLLMPLVVSLLHPIVPLTGDEMKSLPGLLTTSAGYDSFHDFLKLEFSIENLYFWSEVNLYRQHAERLVLADEDEVGDEAIAELLEVARGIYADFIDESTAHQVNLSAPVVKGIRQVLAYVALLTLIYKPKPPKQINKSSRICSLSWFAASLFPFLSFNQCAYSTPHERLAGLSHVL